MGPGPEPEGWGPVRREGWHLTLAFHGEADPGVLARRLEAAAAGAAAPRLRLAGSGTFSSGTFSSGTFSSVAWVAVETAGPGDAAALRALVGYAGGDPDRFVPHVTVLRGQRRRGRAAPPAAGWVEHHGPWWSPAEVLLMASVPSRGGSRYTPVHRVALRRT
nr:2'-5' RNA ligase family protein [Pseudonocardia acidicola]